MCVIAVLPKGVEPNYDELKNCFENNNNGAGYAYQTERGVMIEKGFFNFDKLFGHLSNVGNDVDRVVHFRLATSGYVDQGNCHPFPITKSYDRMRKPRVHTEVAIAHNGIITKCTPPQKSVHSDTMQFVRDYLYWLPRDFYNNKAICDMIDWASANKFAILWKDGFELIGTFNQKNGAFYSNYSWQDYASYYGSYASWSNAKSNYNRTDDGMVNLVFNLSHLKGDVAGIQRMEELIIEALDEEVCNVIDWETHDGKLYVSCLHFPVKTTYFGCYWYTTKIAKKNEIVPIDKIVTEIKEVNGQAVHVVRLLEDGETRPDAGFLTPKEAMPI